jgi:hypothetical protein
VAGRHPYGRQALLIGAVAAAMILVGIGVPVYHHFASHAVVGGPARPASFQVTYRVTLSASGTPSSQWELLTVNRPFAGSDLTYPSAPTPGTQPAAGTLFTKDGLFAVDGTGVHKVSGRQPGPPGDDQDLLAQLPDLGGRGLARRLGTTTVAGRPCTTWRFAAPPVGPLARLSGRDHDDLCIDAEGLVLAEDWTYQGRLVQTKRASRVIVGSVQQPVGTSGATPVPAGTAVPVALPDPTATTFLPPPPTPPGFAPSGLESFAEPDPQTPRQLLAASLVWSFTRGDAVITVEAGTNSPGLLPWQTESTAVRALTLPLGRGESVLRSEGPEIHVDLGGGRWVRIRGTVTLAGLETYARSVSA